MSFHSPIPGRRIVVFALSLFSVPFAFGQRPVQSLSFSLGNTIPVGNFSRSKSVADRGAETGGISEISYQYRPARSAFGFVASARAMGTSLKNSFPVYGSPGPVYANGIYQPEGQPELSRHTGYIHDPANHPGYKTSLHQADLLIGAVMAGVTHEDKIGPRWLIREELQIGLARVMLEKSTMQGSKPDSVNPGATDVFYSSWENSPATGLTGMVKAGPVYRLNKTVQFFLTAGYWYVHTHMRYFSSGRSGVAPAGQGAGSPSSIGLYDETYTYTASPVMKNPAMIDLHFGVRVVL